MAREQLEIIIDGKSKGAVDATKQAEGAMSKLGNTLKGMAIAGGVLFLAKKGFDAMSEAIKKTIGFLKDCIEAAAEEELQIAKLNQALKSTGNYTDEVSESLLKYASSLQEVTMYGDETIIGVEAMLATFKLTEEEIKIATQATLDLAAATGQDLQSAAILMGKAMVGEVGMLKRYGIIVDENKYAAEGWQAVIEEINVEFGGQAVAQGETYTGMVERMKNSFGDMKEKVGNALIPTIEKLMNWFTEGEDIIGAFGAKIGETASPFEKLQGWIGEATTKVQNFLELHWDDMVLVVSTAWEKVSEFIEKLKEADYTKVQDGIGRIKDAFDHLSGDKKEGIEGANYSLQEFIDLTGEVLHAIGTIIGSLKALWATIYFVFGGAIQEVVTLVELLTLAGPIVLSLGSDTTSIEKFNQAVKDMNDWSAKAWQDMEDAWIGFAEFFEEETKETVEETAHEWEWLKHKSEQEMAEMVDRVLPSWHLLQEESTREMAVMSELVRGSLQEVEDKGIIVGSYPYPQITLTDNTAQIKTAHINLQNFINSMRGTHIESTHTITTIHRTITAGTVGAAISQRQVGGSIRKTEFARDLNIPIFEGEAVLPAPVVRAIKENRGSFAGINMSRTGGATINVNVTGNYISEDRDEEELAERIGKVIITKLDQQGALTG